MAGFTGTLTAQIIAMVTLETTGINARIAAMQANDPSLQLPGVKSIVAQNVSVDIAERSGQVQYPVLLVYCEKAQNLQLEKFREFSGKMHFVIETRHTQDTLSQIEQNTEVYVDAVCALLSDARGDWGAGASYSGVYQVDYQPVAMGGSNFVQRAKVSFAVDVSE
jgi:hypothetical protein